MSQSAFVAVLTAVVVAAFAAVWIYAATSTTNPAVRHFLTAGLDTLIPWYRIRLPRRGRHARRWSDTTAEWLAKGAPAPADPPAVGRAAVPLGTATSLTVVDSDGYVHVSEPVSVVATPLTAPLDVRVAEILAHEEDEVVTAVTPRSSVGATEEWSPRDEVAAMRVPPVVARTAPDAEEARILAEFAGLTEGFTEVPDYLVEWGRQVDAYLEAADLNADAHRRWRQQVQDIPTGEWRQSLIFASR